jgi:hypothetical protein
MLQQGGLNRLGVLSLLGTRNRLDRVGDHRRMLRPDLTGRESLSGGWITRLERLAGQAAPGTEPLHRQIPLAGLARITAQLRRDQLRQPAKTQSAGNIARIKLGQDGKLPVLFAGNHSLRLRHRSKQLGVSCGRELLDHMFDSTGSNAHRQASGSRITLFQKVKQQRATKLTPSATPHRCVFAFKFEEN